MENVMYVVGALIGGAFSKAAFDYYWKRFKLRSEVAGGEVRAKDETILILKERYEEILSAHTKITDRQDELIKELTELKMENATLRAELKAVGKRIDDLESENIKLKTMNEILNRK